MPDMSGFICVPFYNWNLHFLLHSGTLINEESERNAPKSG
jgi:hypothetical protein